MSVGILCDRVWKGYCVTNRKGGTKLHEEKSIQGSIALHIANLCRILIFRNVLWISDAEHGISMLDKYQNVGWKKFYLIYGMCDETFSVNCSITPPPEIDREWFMIWVTLLNQIYWVFGATMGAVLGSVIHFDTTGIEFVMTALFFVMFLDQWDTASRHLPSLIGVICSLACLLIFGKNNFMIPAMALIILSFFLCRNRLDDSAKVVKAPKTKDCATDKAANENLLPSTKSLNNKMNESEENA